MANKSIGEYANAPSPVATDKHLLQRADGSYYHILHSDMMFGMKRVLVTLTQGQIQALSGTNITVVDAAGSGTVIDVVEAAAFHDSNGVSFGAGYIRLKHSGGSNYIKKWSTSFQTSATDRYEKAIDGTAVTEQVLLTNTPLVLDASAVFAGAGGTITFDIVYIVKTFS